MIQIHYSENVSYTAALKAVAVLSNNLLDYVQLVYQQLPTYLNRLCKQNPAVYVNLQTLSGTHIDSLSSKIIPVQRFQRIFISPAEARISFQHCQKLIAVDETFDKARYVQTLLLAVTNDANGHILLLAWAIVEVENKEYWYYFMNHLRNTIPEVMYSTIMSDRDKGLLSAEEVLGFGIYRVNCYIHLRENFKTRYGVGLPEKHSWRIAYAKTPQIYEERLLLLRNNKPAVAEYLAGTEIECWVTAFYFGRRYGHYISNTVESLNHTFSHTGICKLPILDLLNEIWHSQMALRFKRHQDVNLCQLLYTKHYNMESEISRIWIQSNSVSIGNQFWGVVQQKIQSVRADNASNEKTLIDNCK